MVPSNTMSLEEAGQLLLNRLTEEECQKILFFQWKMTDSLPYELYKNAREMVAIHLGKKNLFRYLHMILFGSYDKGSYACQRVMSAFPALKARLSEIKIPEPQRNERKFPLQSPEYAGIYKPISNEEAIARLFQLLTRDELEKAIWHIRQRGIKLRINLGADPHIALRATKESPSEFLLGMYLLLFDFRINGERRKLLKANACLPREVVSATTKIKRILVPLENPVSRDVIRHKLSEVILRKAGMGRMFISIHAFRRFLVRVPAGMKIPGQSLGEQWKYYLSLLPSSVRNAREVSIKRRHKMHRLLKHGIKAVRYFEDASLGLRYVISTNNVLVTVENCKRPG